MIIVVSDDFTGAAEIGGIGLKYGLDVEIFTKLPFESIADLVIIATNTRSKSMKEAKEESKLVSTYISNLKPELVFKKIDSVLRGHIVEETRVMMKTLKNKSAVIIPANPRLDRIVKKGIYFIGGKPIAETSFANDPEYSINCSKVMDILSKNKKHDDLSYSKSMDCCAKNGMIIGEVGNNTDMDIWGSVGDNDFLMVGSAGFFEAILKNRAFVKKTDNVTIPENRKNARIIICGSAYHESRSFVRKAKENGFPVSYMSDQLFQSKEINSQEINFWKDEIIGLLKDYNQVILAISHPVIKSKKLTRKLKNILSQVVMAVNQELDLLDFLIEGGSTASEILNLLGFTTLIPIYQYNQGVIKMNVKKAEDIQIVLKPGSYKWPEEVLTIN